MNFIESHLKGAYVIEVQPHIDDRGFFCETWSAREFQKNGLLFEIKQSNLSFNRSKGILRGLHFQRAPHAEEKLIRVSRGSIFDVFADLRPESVSFGKWDGTLLQAGDFKMVYVPKGFAHGYLTLEDNTYVEYLVSELYHPQSAAGVAWNDPNLSIDWPIKEGLMISPKDLANPRLTNLNLK